MKIAYLLAFLLAPAVARADGLGFVDMTRVQAESDVGKACVASSRALRGQQEAERKKRHDALKVAPSAKGHADLDEFKRRSDADLGARVSACRADVEARATAAKDKISRERNVPVLLVDGLPLGAGDDLTDAVVRAMNGTATPAAAAPRAARPKATRQTKGPRP